MPPKAAAGQPQMPIPNQKRRKEVVDTSNPTWPGLEASKSRLASAMDRCEYLATSRNRFTEVCAIQTNVMNNALRSKSAPRLSDAKNPFVKTLNSSVGDVRKMLEDQRNVLTNNKTVYKRVDMLNKYVIAKETKLQGELGAEAAKKSASQAVPTQLKDAFNQSVYDQIFNHAGSPTGEVREWPLMAVACSMPYTAPETALMHGVKKDGSSTMNSTRTSAMNSSRMAKTH